MSTKKEKKKLSLTAKIFIGMLLGILMGILLADYSDITEAYILPFGTIYINLLKYMVVPVVFFSLVVGMVALGDIKKVGSIGWRTIVYFLVTTAFAIIIGLVFANLFKGSFPVLQTSGLEYEANSSTFSDVVVGIFPSNWLQPLVEGDMLPTIVSALFIGSGILVAGDSGKKVAEGFSAFYDVVMKVLEMIIKLTPIGVFCLMTNTIAQNGAAIISSLGIVLGASYLGYLTHVIVVYGISVKGVSKVPLGKFFKAMGPAMTTAFSTTSSNAALPLGMEGTNKLGVDREISSFVLPLGATINMDGTAIYMGVATVFIASCYGIDLTMGQLVTVVLTAILASIGTAGMPGAGMIMLAMVLQTVGLPVEGIALIAGVDKLFDMGRTCVNITGDATCALALDHWKTKRESKEIRE